MKPRLFLMIFLFHNATLAAGIELAPEASSTETGAWMNKPLHFATDIRDLFSRKLVSMSDGLDSFIGSERATDEVNGSHLRIRQLNTFYQNGSIEPKFETIFKLDLPRTNKRLSLVIESTEDDGEGNERETVPTNPVLENPEQRNTAVNSAIQWVIQRNDDWDIRARVGVQLSDKLPNPNTKLRARRLFDLGSWEFRITETLFWYLADGWGETTLFDLERPVTRTFFFRASNQSTWLKHDNTFNISQKFTLFHTIGKKRVLYLQAAAYADNKPNLRITTYVSSVHYRQLIYKDWLFAEITPMIIFPESNDFDFSPAITLTFDMWIGATQ